MASHRNAGELIQKVFWLFGLTFDQKGRGLQVDMIRTDSTKHPIITLEFRFEKGPGRKNGLVFRIGRTGILVSY
jgi:hypothetical protein